MRVRRTAARLRAILQSNDDFSAVLRGAGVALTIRVLASAVTFASVILLARWLGPSEYGLYSFAIAWMTLLAYPATLGLPGAAVRLVAQYVAANDWQHVVGFVKASSWIAFSCGAMVAIVALGALLVLRIYLDPGYFAPTVVALAGIPILAVTIVRSEAVRGVGWLALAWGPLQLGQPLLLLAVTATVLLVATQLTATAVVGASIFAYAANLIVQREFLRRRFERRTTAKPKVQPGRWLSIAVSFLWISLANVTLLQAGVIVVGIFLRPQDVAIYGAAVATSRLVSFPLHAVAALSAPKFAALHAKERQLDLQALLTNVIRLTWWPSLGIALIIVTFGSILLRLFGPGFEQGYVVLLILTLGQLVNAAFGPLASLLSMTGNHILTARVLGTSSILAVVCGLVLTPIWGTVGTAVAFSGAMVLLNIWLAVFVVRKLRFYIVNWRRRPYSM